MSPPQVVTMIWTKVIYFTIYKIFIVSHNFSLFITNTISPPPPTHSKLLMPTLHHIRHKKCTQPLGTVAITLKKLVGTRRWQLWWLLRVQMVLSSSFRKMVDGYGGLGLMGRYGAAKEQGRRVMKGRKREITETI